MLTGYFDETGHEGPDHVIIAGFVGNDSQWTTCARAWREGLGQRSGLHMSELRWGQPRTKELLERLGPIPGACGLQAVIGGVRVSDYEDLVDSSPWVNLGRGYFGALYPLIIRLLRWLPPDERIEIVFDRQEHYQPLAEFIFRETQTFPEFLSSDGQPKLAKWSYVPRSSTILTQPADYYAYALLQNLRDSKSIKTQWCSPILRDNLEPIGSILTKDQIRAEIKHTHKKMKTDFPNRKNPIPLR